MYELLCTPQVSCDGGTNFHPVHFHFFYHDGYSRAPEAQRFSA